MFFCLGTEGSKGSLLRTWWFQCFPVKELKDRKVPYLEMGGSNVFLYRNLRFQGFLYLEMGGSCDKWKS